MQLTSTDYLPGYRIQELYGPVFGMVSSPLIRPDEASGEPGKTYAIALSSAVGKMEEQARSLYGSSVNVILGLRVSPCAVSNLSYLVMMVFGTAAAAVAESGQQDEEDAVPEEGTDGKKEKNGKKKKGKKKEKAAKEETGAAGKEQAEAKEKASEKERKIRKKEEKAKKKKEKKAAKKEKKAEKKRKKLDENQKEEA